MNNAKVDVVIPVYKPDSQLLDLLKAILEQTYPVNKIILINTEEEFFDQEIANNEDDYVIVTDKRPSFEDLRTALLLATKIKDINNSTDLSTAFSFSPDETDKLLTLPELSDGNL